MERIRPAVKDDLSRIAEIFVFNNRVNYFPIFRDEGFSFGELQVLSLAQSYLADGEKLARTSVYDDGLVRGFIETSGSEIVKLYVDPFFQSRGFGDGLLRFAVEQRGARFLWALEKNVRAVAFYARHGFLPNGERKFEEGTEEYLIKLVRA